jgi:hypothetical protein
MILIVHVVVVKLHHSEKDLLLILDDRAPVHEDLAGVRL